MTKLKELRSVGAKFDPEHGGWWYTGEEVALGQTAVDALQGAFGFCGCGCAEDNLRFIADGLLHVKARNEAGEVASKRERERRAAPDDWSKHCAEWRGKESSLFGSDRIAYFFYYWADSENLLEHGVGIGASSLTDKGKQLIEDIEAALAEAAANQEST